MVTTGYCVPCFDVIWRLEMFLIKLIVGLIVGAIGLVIGLLGGVFGLVVGVLGGVLGLIVGVIALIALPVALVAMLF